jgi:hypothetical protein
MAKYRVIVYETTAFTYEIEADSPEAAKQKWEDSEDEELPASDEIFLGVDDVTLELA